MRCGDWQMTTVPSMAAKLIAAVWEAALILASVLLVSAAAFSDGLTAAQILQKVSDTYRSPRSFRYVEKWTDSLGIKTGMGPGSVETTVAESKPGKVRVSSKLYLLVSDGEMTWTYLPGPNQYTEIAAAPLLDEEWTGDPVAGHYLGGYQGFGRAKALARLEGEKRLKIGGKRIECDVIELSYNTNTLGKLTGTVRRGLWVDRARFLVWRDEYQDLGAAGPPEGATGLVTATLKEMSTSPLPSRVFNFVPPKGAKRVASFPGGAYGHPWSDLAFYDAPGANTNSYLVGIPAPDFTADDLNGSNVRLSELRGKIVALAFWASWCKPCQKELADIQKLHDEVASQGVIFLGVNDEDSETMKGFVKAHGYTFRMLSDPQQLVHQLYGASWAPTVVVIDRNGNLVVRYIGAEGEAGLRRALEAAGLNPQGTTKPR